MPYCFLGFICKDSMFKCLAFYLSVFVFLFLMLVCKDIFVIGKLGRTHHPMDFVVLRHPYGLNSSILWTYIWIRSFRIRPISGFKQSQSVFLVDSFISWTLYWTRHLVDLIIILTLSFCGWTHQLYELVHFIDFNNKLVHFVDLAKSSTLWTLIKLVHFMDLIIISSSWDEVVHFRDVNKVVDFMDINNRLIHFVDLMINLSILWT